MVAAGGPEAAELAGRIGDGLVAHRPDTELVDDVRVRRRQRQAALRPGDGLLGARPRGGASAPRTSGGRTPALQGELAQELPLPSHFEQAAARWSPRTRSPRWSSAAPTPSGIAKAIEDVRRRGLRPRLHPPGRPRPGGLLALLRARDPAAPRACRDVRSANRMSTQLTAALSACARNRLAAFSPGSLL